MYYLHWKWGHQHAAVTRDRTSHSHNGSWLLGNVNIHSGIQHSGIQLWITNSLRLITTNISIISLAQSNNFLPNQAGNPVGLCDCVLWVCADRFDSALTELTLRWYFWFWFCADRFQFWFCADRFQFWFCADRFHNDSMDANLPSVSFSLYSL